MPAWLEGEVRRWGYLRIASADNSPARRVDFGRSCRWLRLDEEAPFSRARECTEPAPRLPEIQSVRQELSTHRYIWNQY